MGKMGKMEKREEKEKEKERWKEDSFRNVGGTDGRTYTQVILYSVQCYVQTKILLFVYYCA